MLRRDGDDDVAAGHRRIACSDGDGVRCGVERGYPAGLTHFTAEFDDPGGCGRGKQRSQVASRQQQVAVTVASAEGGVNRVAEDLGAGHVRRRVERGYAQRMPQQAAQFFGLAAGELTDAQVG